MQRVHDVVVSVNVDRGRCMKWRNDVVASQRGGLLVVPSCRI